MAAAAAGGGARSMARDKAHLDQVKGAVSALKASFQKANPDLAACKAQVSKIKLQLLEFDLLPPFYPEKKMAGQQLQTARSALELAVIISAVDKDFDSFRKNMAQLRVFYRDFTALGAEMLPQSEMQWAIVGLNLVFLLASNKPGEFHTELESIPVDTHENKFIAFPLKLEQELMAGNYNQVMKSSKQVPVAYYQAFMSHLMRTVREKIGACAASSYKTLRVDQARGIFLLDSDDDVRAFCADKEWPISDEGVITFPKDAEKSLEIPARRLITQTLGYATELERIV